MKIRFLKNSEAPIEVWHTHCECCGPQREGTLPHFFCEGDEIDPDETYNVVDISALKFNVDYIIIEYP